MNQGDGMRGQRRGCCEYIQEKYQSVGGRVSLHPYLVTSNLWDWSIQSLSSFLQIGAQSLLIFQVVEHRSFPHSSYSSSFLCIDLRRASYQALHKLGIFARRDQSSGWVSCDSSLVSLNGRTLSALRRSQKFICLLHSGEKSLRLP